MPIATSEKSSWKKEILKNFAGFSPSYLLGENTNDVFFQHNSMTGDLLTEINPKDKNSNMDAYIFKYHPDFKNVPLNIAIYKYYNLTDLENKRLKYYSEAQKAHSPEFTSKEHNNIMFYGGLLSLGGAGLILLPLIQSFKKDPKTFMKEKIWGNIKKIPGWCLNKAKEFLKDPLGFIGSNILGPTSNLLVDTTIFAATSSYYLIKKVTYPIGSKIIKPISNWANNKYKRYVSPVLKKIHKEHIRPKIQWVKKKYRKYVKPAVKWVKRQYRKYVKPAAKWVKHKYRKYVKPAVDWVGNRTWRPVYKKIVKPVLKPIYKKIVKPAARYINRKVVKPIRHFFKKFFG